MLRIRMRMLKDKYDDLNSKGMPTGTSHSRNTRYLPLVANGGWMLLIGIGIGIWGHVSRIFQTARRERNLENLSSTEGALLLLACATRKMLDSR
jgi:hypothetical protein